MVPWSMHALPLPPAVPLPNSPMLARCLLLALLLHVWLVLLLGNAPGGTAREGQGVWGSINVTLRGPETKGTAEAPVARTEERRDGPPGSADVPRYGGAVREAGAPTPPEPGAAQLGEWAVRPALPAAPAAEAAITPIAPIAPAQAVPELPLPAPVPPGRVLEERRVPQAVPLQAPLVAPAPLAPALPAAPPAPSLRPPLQSAPPPPVERNLSSTLPREAPVVRPVAPIESAAPTAAPALPPQRLPSLAPPIEIPPPEAPTRRLETPLPPAPATTAPVAPLAPAASLAEPTALAPAAAPALSPALAPANAPAPAPALAPAMTPNPGAAGAAPTTTLPGAPDAGSRLGADVATPPSAPASAPPRLNLELPRSRGGEISRGGSRGVLPVMPRPPELSDRLARDIEKSAKSDCRTAHAGAGLLAVVPLAVDAARKEGNCKW